MAYSRVKTVKNLSKPDTIYGKAWFSTLLVLVFVAIDFSWLANKWNLLQTGGDGYRYGIALGFAVALDVPMAVVAVVLKRYHQGLTGRKISVATIVAVAIVTFLGAFFANFFVGIVARDQLFSLSENGGLVDAAAGAAAGIANMDSKTILYLAAANGLLPLFTSLSSFVFSYFAYNPLRNEITKQEKAKVELQSEITKINKELAESPMVEAYKEEMLEREEQLFKEFMQRLEAEYQEMKQTAGSVLMEKMKTPAEVTVVFRDRQKQMEQYQQQMNPKKLPESEKDFLILEDREEASDQESVDEDPDENFEEFSEEREEGTEEENTEENTEEQNAEKENTEEENIEEQDSEKSTQKAA